MSRSSPPHGLSAPSATSGHRAWARERSNRGPLGAVPHYRPEAAGRPDPTYAANCGESGSDVYASTIGPWARWLLEDIGRCAGTETRQRSNMPRCGSRRSGPRSLRSLAQALCPLAAVDDHLNP